MGREKNEQAVVVNRQERHIVANHYLRPRIRLYLVSMAATKLLAFGEAAGCLLVCQAAATARSDEWARYLEAVARYLKTNTKPRLLVLTAGGAPTPEQRRNIDLLLDPHRARMKVAIVTDSTFARGVVKAIRLVYPFYQAFARKELESALRFLDVRPADDVEVKRCAEELLAELSS